MKKQNILWSLLAVLMVAVLSIGMVSCSDDDDGKGNKGNNDDNGGSVSNTLVGTSWVCKEGGETRTIYFNSDDAGTIAYEYNGTEIERESFSYTYSSRTQAGTIIVRVYDSYKGRYTNEAYDFEIDGNKLYLEGEDDEFVFTKNGQTGGTGSSQSVSGTSWMLDAGQESVTISFKSNGTGTIVEKWYGSYGWETETMSFTYTMTGDGKGRMVVKEYDSYYDDEEIFYFEVKGQKLYIYDEDYDLDLVLTKI